MPFIGHLFVCPSGCWLPAPGCWLSAPRSGRFFVCPRSSLSCTNGIFVCPRSSLSCTNGIFVCPRSSLSCTNGLFRLPDATYPSSRAQKCRFCARNARNRGSGGQKAHKNPDFVLEMPENEGSRPQKRTKNSISCSKCQKMRGPDPKSAQKPRFCARNARK